jgi:altronate dehydratase large subunit
MSDSYFLGYRRANGTIGIRNHVLVLAVMDNVNGVVKNISQLVSPSLPVTVWYGRGQFGEDDVLFRRTQTGLATNPNIASVLVVSLEKVSAQKVAQDIAERGVPVEYISVQDIGGTVEAIAAGVRKLIPMVLEASSQMRSKASLGELVLGVECGGTDTSSGITANPALGYVADRVVDAGGTVYLSETSEWMGAEQVLARRAKDDKVAEMIWAAVRRVEDSAHERGVDIRGTNPVPDNIRGGITTIEEKSLGAIIKGGSREIQGVLDYAVPATGKGLFLMDTAAPAAESMTGLAAAGAQLILFSTGQMNIMGSRTTPTIKVTGNPHTVERLRDNVDVDVSPMLRGESVEQAGGRLLERALGVCNGGLTKAEILGDTDIAISRIQPTV